MKCLLLFILLQKKFSKILEKPTKCKKKEKRSLTVNNATVPRVEFCSCVPATLACT